jgi:glycosidase
VLVLGETDSPPKLTILFACPNLSAVQVLTDRFYTGSDNPPQCNLNNYCGGTWQGIADKLDYITSMGFDAIWISPIVENTPNGYHGYWAADLQQVNSNFCTQQDLLNLVGSHGVGDSLHMFALRA